MMIAGIVRISQVKAEDNVWTAGSDRVRNPKNQLLQIDQPTIVGCSW